MAAMVMRNPPIMALIISFQQLLNEPRAAHYQISFVRVGTGSMYYSRPNKWLVRCHFLRYYLENGVSASWLV